MSVFDNRPTEQYITRAKLFLRGETPDSILKKDNTLVRQALEQHYKIFMELQKLGNVMPTRKEAVYIGNVCNVSSTRVFKTANAVIRVMNELKSHVPTSN